MFLKKNFEGFPSMEMTTGTFCGFALFHTKLTAASGSSYLIKSKPCVIPGLWKFYTLAICPWQVEKLWGKSRLKTASPSDDS